MQSPINRPEDAPSAVGCASSLGREAGVGDGTVKGGILHRGQNWEWNAWRDGEGCMVGRGLSEELCEWLGR